MPTYTYRCPKCSNTLELVRPVADRDFLPVCVELGCDGQRDMSRTMSTSSLVFKGAGWTSKFYGKDD